MVRFTHKICSKNFKLQTKSVGPNRNPSDRPGHHRLEPVLLCGAGHPWRWRYKRLEHLFCIQDRFECFQKEGQVVWSTKRLLLSILIKWQPDSWFLEVVLAYISCSRLQPWDPGVGGFAITLFLMEHPSHLVSNHEACIWQIWGFSWVFLLPRVNPSMNPTPEVWKLPTWAPSM